MKERKMVADKTGEYEVEQGTKIVFEAQLNVDNYGLTVTRNYKHVVKVCDIYDKEGRPLSGGKVILRVVSMKEGLPER